MENQNSKAAATAHSGRGTDSAAKDEAIAMVGEQQQHIDPAVAARAVRKIDLFLIPVMMFGCTRSECF